MNQSSPELVTDRNPDPNYFKPSIRSLDQSSSFPFCTVPRKGTKTRVLARLCVNGGGSFLGRHLAHRLSPPTRLPGNIVVSENRVFEFRETNLPSNLDQCPNRFVQIKIHTMLCEPRSCQTSPEARSLRERSVQSLRCLNIIFSFLLMIHPQVHLRIPCYDFYFL